MEKLVFDMTKKYGDFKPLHAVNNGPSYKRGNSDQLRSNFETYKAIGIPYARNHDASFNDTFGGEHTVDISAVFPNFDADENDPNSYDFDLTDEYIEATMDAGTETFYRLGQKIEHNKKKYGTVPPKDFDKWARICEHIILHCNYGWANGHHYNIKYWEIWNEPDLDPDDALNKRTWGGTKAQFFDLYSITAKHLKSRFPELSIGGPALAHEIDWAEDFIKEMHKREVPIDFFSWHIYTEEPIALLERGIEVRKLLDENGYTDTESNCNEWNYIRGWTEEFIYSIKCIISAKGASFALACMCIAQSSPIDMLMYYDASPSVFNCLFDFYTLEPIAGYYSFLWYSKLYKGCKEVRSENNVPDIYTLCGVNEQGKRILLCTHYNSNDDTNQKDISFDLGGGKYNVYLVNNGNLNTHIKTTTDLTFTLNNFDCILLEEI